MTDIDARAIVDPGAQLAEGVKIGPFSLIGPDVMIGSGTQIASHVVVVGHTRFGRNNQVYSFSTIGEAPQDLKYHGEPTHLEIGDDNVIREAAVIHRGTVQGGGTTRIGDGNLLMAHCHVAHDCILHNHVIMANYAALAGHVILDDHVILGGMTTVSQHCYVGKHVYTAAATAINKSVPAYASLRGQPARPCGINEIGLERRGFSAVAIGALRRAYRTLNSRKLLLEQALEALEEQAEEVPELQELIASVRRGKGTGIIRR